MCACSSETCGSLLLDLRFRELVRVLLADHPAHLDASSLAYFMHNFSEIDKLAYMGEADDGELPRAVRLFQQALLLFLCWFGILTPPFMVRTRPCLVSGKQKRHSTITASTWRTRMILPWGFSTANWLFLDHCYAERFLSQL